MKGEAERERGGGYAGEEDREALMQGRKKGTEECGREEHEGGREGAAEEDEAEVKGQAACGHQGRIGRFANPLLCLPPRSLLPLLITCPSPCPCPCPCISPDPDPRS